MAGIGQAGGLSRDGLDQANNDRGTLDENPKALFLLLQRTQPAAAPARSARAMVGPGGGAYGQCHGPLDPRASLSQAMRTGDVL